MVKATFAARGCRLIATFAAIIAGALASLSLGSASALAAGEPHPLRSSFGSFTDPSGIAVDEATGDVYVADAEAETVSKFDASGNPVDFASLGGNELTGAETSANTFSFASAKGTPAALAVDNACIEHTPALTGSACAEFDPSAGDLYVMDSGANVIYKFNSAGEYLGEVSDPSAGAHLLGIGIDAKGELRVHVDDTTAGAGKVNNVDVFDDEPLNAFAFTLQLGNTTELEPLGAGVAPNGDMYLPEMSCGCVHKWGGGADTLGQVDNGPEDIAAAVDPMTGHVYVDEQSSVAEWDSGAMNGGLTEGYEFANWEGSAASVASFGSASLGANASGQGGIAVNGQNGQVYVSSPADGKVYVFGTSVPRVAAKPGTDVKQTTATLNGVVNPGGEAVTSCRFEYEVVRYHLHEIEYIDLTEPVTVYRHSVPCAQGPATIGAGSAPVPVSAEVGELQAGHLYDFRVVAENAQGESFADERLASEGPGFGFKGFAVGFLEKDGTPDTQAGSHPFEMSTTILMNTKTVEREKNADARYVTEPDGNPRDIIVDLPPGLVGDPDATPKKCTIVDLEKEKCPEESKVGELKVQFAGEYTALPPSLGGAVYNLVPPRGVPVQLGADFIAPDLYIDANVQAGGDYPVRSVSPNITQLAPMIEARLQILGVVGKGTSRKPFLTLPTGCNGPLKSAISADSYQDPGHFVEATSLSVDSSGQPVPLTGCAKLRFPASITVAPDTTDGSTASGLTVGVHVPQKSAFDPEGLAESALRDTTVTLPEGVAINPSGGDGLEACSSEPAALAAGALGSPGDQIGYEGTHEFNPEYEPGVKWSTFTPETPNPLDPGLNFCPNGAKIGTVKISTPLLEHELEGAVYLAQQNANPFGSLIAMYLVAEDPVSGTLIKLAGEVTLTPSGQIVTTFENTPDLPFENLEMHFFGGERAPLSTPARCGAYTTKAVFTPWDGNGAITSESSFNIEHGPDGGPCPGASLPFSPTLNAGTTSNDAGNFSPFSTTIQRQDGEQNMQSVTLHMPSGLSGMLTGVKLCPEAQANEGTCGPESQIGETTVAAGVGSDPISVKGGKVYLTEKYDGAPFGLSIVDPVKAGPFDLEHDTSKPATNMPPCDCVVVRAKIEINPLTAALTVTTDPSGPHVIPHLIDGIPVQIQRVNVLIDRPGFTFNPTSCASLAITGTIASDEGAAAPVSVPFQAANCATLPFEPKFEAFTKARHTRRGGAYLHVVMRSGEGQAGIHLVKVELPKALPSELKTLQKACTEDQFAKDPAGCPAESIVGHAEVQTPVLPVPLQGPAYFVSNGSAEFPELTIVLQGYGVTVQLHGKTYIDPKTDITSSTFETVPDVPFTRFDLVLPSGSHPALHGNGDFCAENLRMPTRIVAQSGKAIQRSTPIEVAGCPNALSVRSHRVRRRTLILRVYAPSAGKVEASGRGLDAQTKRAAARKVLVLRLHEQRAKRLRTKVSVVFMPRTGTVRKRQVKTLSVRLKSPRRRGADGIGKG